MYNTKIKGLVAFVPLAAVFLLALLLSWPSLSLATLTVSNTGLQGDTNITLDTNGTLGVGTASATAITIGQAALNVSVPGGLTVSSSTTVGKLKLPGSSSGTDTIQASSTAGTWTLTLPTSAGSSGYVLSTDGSGNTSWIAQSGGSSLTIDGLTNSTFNLTASGTGLTIATSSPNTIAYTWTNPGYVTASSTVTWSSPQTFNATSTFLGPIVESGSGGGYAQLTEGTCPAAVSGADILCANSSHVLQLSLNGGSFLGVPELAGDLGNTVASPKVVGLQGIPVSTTTPTTNQVLAYNGSSWAPANASSTGSGITAINGLSNATTSIAAGSGITIATSSPNIITITATGGGASSTWSGISNPIANLSLNMGNFSTTFTVGATTTNPFLIQDTTGNTGTGPLLQVSTIGTSAASPVEFTAQGTSNGIQMNASGTLAVIGTGNINATQLQGVAVSTTTPTTNQILTYNGTKWAPAAASGGGSINVNGSSVSSPNFNGTTPASPTSSPPGALNTTYQVSGSNVSSYLFGAQDLPGWRVIGTEVAANGGGANALGDTSQPLSTAGGGSVGNNTLSSSDPVFYETEFTAATSSDIAERIPNNTPGPCYIGHNCLLTAAIKLPDWNSTPATAAQRAWIALSPVGATTLGSDTPSQNFMGVRASDCASGCANDTDFIGVVGDGSGSVTTCDTGVPLDTHWHFIAIQDNIAAGTPSVSFYVDTISSPSCTISSGHLPAASTAVGELLGVATQTNGVRHLRWSNFEISSDFK